MPVERERPRLERLCDPQRVDHDVGRPGVHDAQRMSDVGAAFYGASMVRPRGARQRLPLVVSRLAELYPDVRCALDHRNPYELTVATILSAQTTDEQVNLVTPALFTAYPRPEDLAGADLEAVEELVHSTGFFRSKAKNILGMARALVADYGGEIPSELTDLVRLPGVGRKTGNVIRSVAFDLPGLPVDTHVGRLTRRLKLTREEDPVKVELELNELVPPAERGRFSLRLIDHGRQVCDARAPRCDACGLADLCPSAGTF